jgi:hypothetical protein
MRLVEVAIASDQIGQFAVCSRKDAIKEAVFRHAKYGAAITAPFPPPPPSGLKCSALMRTLTAAAIVVIQYPLGTFLGDVFTTSDLPALHFIDARLHPPVLSVWILRLVYQTVIVGNGILPASSYAAR